jgi:NAD(P)-dependent dehydrogenase (short-subunit alcohol dehydrogenase family)
MEMSLEGSKVVVVGGSSGIGLASAASAAAEGARVIIAGRSKERLSAARRSIEAPVEARQLDMTDDASIEAFFGELGPLDHLVITASGAALGRFLEIDTADARRFFESKFWGPYAVARRAAPQIRLGGSITFFSGAAGSRASPGFSCGSAINVAVEALSRTLSVELAPVRVNTVSPGLVDTPIWESIVSSTERQALFADTAAKLPAGRIGRPEDVADAVLFLIRNAYTTGTTLFVDGGYRHM